MQENKPIIIVGAGAAGIGLGILLQRLKLPFVILEQGKVGESFSRWPDETQFISPSFSGNAFGSVDLNSLSPDTSPAFSLMSEHPSGEMFNKYLRTLASHFELPIITSIRVNSIQHNADDEEAFTLSTSKGIKKAKHLIWAAGEFQYPNLQGFKGAEHCYHYTEIDSWKNLTGEDFSVIGAYESGIDAAYQLTKLGKSVTVFDSSNKINQHGSDSSYTLSPFTRERLRQVQKDIQVVKSRVTEIEKFSDGYGIHTNEGEQYSAKHQPINCSGFSSSLQLIKPLLEFEDGYAKLNKFDESSVCPNLFITGPQVRHGEALFCFIYKFRQRFGIIGEELSKRCSGNETIREEVIDYYKNNQFYLDDLSCCEDECSC